MPAALQDDHSEHVFEGGDAVTLPLVLVGGECRRDKLVRIQAAHAVLRIEWIPIKRSGSLVRRVRAGYVAGVVMLEGLVGHGRTAPLIRALRIHDVPIEYAGRAGIASVLRAVTRLESSCGNLAKRDRTQLSNNRNEARPVCGQPPWYPT